MPVEMAYSLGVPHFSVQGLMCTFELRTTNLMDLGCHCEVTKQGTINAHFNPLTDRVRPLGHLGLPHNLI